MKVSSINNSHLTQQASNRLGQKGNSVQKTDASVPASADFQPSNASAGGGQGIDQARVDEIRQAISNGELQFHPENIADAIIASAQELVSE